MIRIFIWLSLILVLVYSPFIGAVDIKIDSLLNQDSLSSKVFFDLRIPRVLLAFCAGVILSLSGLLFQTLFRNSLMTPYTLGISSGAVLGAGIAIKLGLGVLIFGISTMSLFGFFGAMITLIFLMYLSRYIKSSQPESLLLLGIALSLFYTSTLMLIFYLGSAIQNDMLLRFTMGSLSIVGWSEPILIAIFALLLFIFIYLYRFELAILGISQNQAKLRGVNSKKITLLLLTVSSLGVGVLVSISGPIGFVGLIVPHIVAKIYPVSISYRISKTAFFGGLFLVFCDTSTRMMQMQSELPIGIVTAFIGAPFFIYLIINKKNAK